MQGGCRLRSRINGGLERNNIHRYAESVGDTVRRYIHLYRTHRRSGSTIWIWRYRGRYVSLHWESSGDVAE